MDIVVLGIDLGKNVCSVVGLGAAGQVLLRRRMKRESVVAFTQRWPASVVAMEACWGHKRLACERRYLQNERAGGCYLVAN